MERKLEIRKRGPEKGQEKHRGCKRRYCTLQILLREKGRTEGLIRESDAEKRRSTNFDDILLNYDMQRYDERRLCSINEAIERIGEQGNCDCVRLEGLIPGYIIEDMIKERPRPPTRPESRE